MSSQNLYVIRRFILKTGLLTLFALAQWRHGIALTLGILFGTASMIDIGLALYGRTPFRRYQLSYWDEAVAFTLMSCLATAIAIQ